MTVPEEAADLVAGRQLMAFVATSHDDRPHAAPVWYNYDDGGVEFLTGGRKLANLRANPRVCVSIQEDDEGEALWYVSLFGTAEVDDDPDAVRAGMDRVYPTYMGPREEWEESYRDQYDDPDEGFALVRVDVGSATYSVYDD